MRRMIIVNHVQTSRKIAVPCELLFAGGADVLATYDAGRKEMVFTSEQEPPIARLQALCRAQGVGMRVHSIDSALLGESGAWAFAIAPDGTLRVEQAREEMVKQHFPLLHARREQARPLEVLYSRLHARFHGYVLSAGRQVVLTGRIERDHPIREERRLLEFAPLALIVQADLEGGVMEDQAWNEFMALLLDVARFQTSLLARQVYSDTTKVVVCYWP